MVKKAIPLTAKLSPIAEVRLGIISDQSLAETLPDMYEPLVTGPEPVFLRDVIEDELILALPLVPKHPNEQCKESLDSKSSGHSINPSVELNNFLAMREAIESFGNYPIMV